MKKHRFAYRLGWRSLRRVVPSLTPAQAKALARSLGQAMHEHQICTRRRAAMFIAQTAEESVGYHFTEEIASGAEYEGRHDLGNTHQGDGVRFKGRGFIQITGRNNYAAVSKAFGVDFIKHPQRLAEQRFAAKTAAWWWEAHGCNELADRDDFVAVTKRINGGLNGFATRLAYYSRAKPRAVFLVPRRRRP